MLETVINRQFLTKMKQSLVYLLLRFPNPYISDVEIQALLKGSQHSRYGKIKRALASGELLHVRRGLYTVNEKLFPQRKLHPFELAQFTYGPSYVSLESALSYHGLIPEHPVPVTCVTSKRSCSFQTEQGEFIYHKLPVENLFIQVDYHQTTEAQFWLASPWKAIGDFVYVYDKNWKGLSPLAKSLRIELEELPKTTATEFNELTEYYHNKRLDRFFKSILKELPL